MKRGITILFFVILIFGINHINSEETSLSPTEVSVIVDTQPPSINILSPLNETYNPSIPILINYTIIEPTLDSIWYSLNSQPNITLPNTDSFTLNLAEGDYQLIIYANDSFSRLNFSEVYFSVNVSAPFCGDATCNTGEDCSNCSGDCGACPEPPTNGGGGGGGGGSSQADFSIDKEEITLTLKQGETKKQQITIKNTDRTTLSFTTSVLEIDNLILISEETFTLKQNEEKTITLDIIARENLLPNLYVGKLIIESSGTKKEVLIAIELETPHPLFDVELKIPKKFKTVLPGKEIMANIELFNIGETEKMDVKLTYTIKDSKDIEILSEKEIITVETKKSIEKTFQIPNNIKYGDYILYVNVDYEGESASASEWFIVGEKSTLNYNIVIGIIIFVILFLLYSRKKQRKIK